MWFRSVARSCAAARRHATTVPLRIIDGPGCRHGLATLRSRSVSSRCSTTTAAATIEADTVRHLFLQGAGRRRNGLGQTRVCTVVTGGGGRLFGHLLAEPGATSFLLEGTVPYDKHAFFGYLSSQGRELPAGFCSAESAVALARAARDRAMALTRRIDRWPDCAGVSATATLVSHYPRRGGYRAHAASADAFDDATSYEHTLVKGARERPEEDAAVARLVLRACAEVARVPMPAALAEAIQTAGVVLAPVERTNAVGEVAQGVEAVPQPVAVAPEAPVGARVWVPGLERPIVAPATLPDNALLVPSDGGLGRAAQASLAAEALRALGWEGEEGDGPWVEPPAPVLFDVGALAAAATDGGAAVAGQWGLATAASDAAVTNWGCVEVLAGAGAGASAPDRLDALLRRYPRATYALTSDAALRLASDRDVAIAASAAGARFVVARGAVEAAKRAWELPRAALAAFTWIGAVDNDVRTVVAADGGAEEAGGAEEEADPNRFEGRVTGLTDGSPSTEIGTGRYVGGWVDGRPHGRGVMEWDNGVVFDGSWADGKYDGVGSKRYSRGGGYVGEWAAGRRSGAGTSLYAAGRWEGAFVDDRPDGLGTMFYDGEADGEEGRPFRFEAGKPLDGKEPKHRGGG